MYEPPFLDSNAGIFLVWFLSVGLIALSLYVRSRNIKKPAATKLIKASRIINKIGIAGSVSFCLWIPNVFFHASISGGHIGDFSGLLMFHLFLNIFFLLFLSFYILFAACFLIVQLRRSSTAVDPYLHTVTILALLVSAFSYAQGSAS